MTDAPSNISNKHYLALPNTCFTTHSCIWCCEQSWTNPICQSKRNTISNQTKNNLEQGSHVKHIASNKVSLVQEASLKRNMDSLRLTHISVWNYTHTRIVKYYIPHRLEGEQNPPYRGVDNLPMWTRFGRAGVKTNRARRKPWGRCDVAATA